VEEKFGRRMASWGLFWRALDLRVRPGWKYHSESTCCKMSCLGLTIESGRNKVALASWRIQGRVRTRLVVSGGGECGLVGRMDPSRTSMMSLVERI